MTLARFTPSVLDGETLERLFVQRHHLLDDVMAAVRDAASGDERRHKLFVGPRGAGKTHLISVVNHRVRQARADGLQVALSWLMEDPWDIETYDDLLDQILETLSDGRPESDGEHAIHGVVAADGPVVVLVENLDQILTAIGVDGQRRLRALLENDRPLLLIATSTRLSDDLLSQAEPFYGFFDEIQLEPFSVEQAADMLWHVADYSDDEPLAALLESPQASARLATIAHLAGGQPRVWALLGAGLTDTGIGDMVDMLLARFDDLTPYYQEQLARLSPSERKAVRRLADADRPLTVRDLAELAKTDQRSMSKTVSDLRKRGWVRKHESILTAKLDGRLSYYELAEPLARIAFQMKAARGEPVRLIVDFVSAWFDLEELDVDQLTISKYLAVAHERFGVTRAMVRILTGGGIHASSRGATIDAVVGLDAALAKLESTGDATDVLALPAAISQLVAERLATLGVLDLRLMLAEFAVMHGAAADWRPALEEIASKVGGERLARSIASLLVSEVARGELSRALVGRLDEVLADLPEERARVVVNRLVTGLLCLPDPEPHDLLATADELRILRQPWATSNRAALHLFAALGLARLGEGSSGLDFLHQALSRVSQTDANALELYRYGVVSILTLMHEHTQAIAFIDSFVASPEVDALFTPLREQAQSRLRV